MPATADPPLPALPAIPTLPPAPAAATGPAPAGKPPAPAADASWATVPRPATLPAQVFAAPGTVAPQSIVTPIVPGPQPLTLGPAAYGIPPYPYTPPPADSGDIVQRALAIADRIIDGHLLPGYTGDVRAKLIALREDCELELATRPAPADATTAAA